MALLHKMLLCVLRTLRHPINIFLFSIVFWSHESGAVDDGKQFFVEAFSMGSEDAPVKITEFFSFSCSHCISFHKEYFDEIKTKYIDTGKVLWTFRETYYDRYGLQAAIISRCGGKNSYYGLLARFMEHANEIKASKNVSAELQRYGRIAGLPQSSIDDCMNNTDFAKDIVERYYLASKKMNVTGTPTFFVGDVKLTGLRGASNLSKIIDEQLADSE